MTISGLTLITGTRGRSSNGKSDLKMCISSSIKVCVVVPMYNEEKIALHSVETICSYINELPPIIKLLIINDGSKDNTENILMTFIYQNQNKSDDIELISHAVNQGYGAALRTGIKYSIENNYDYILFMDSDLTNHPIYLVKFYEKMIEGWDYIKATRYAKGGGTKGVPLKRLFISKYGNIFARFVTGLPLTDITNGFRAVKVNIINQINLTENHFAIIIEELMKVRKITNRFCEVPNILGTREKEARPTKFKYNVETFYKYIKYLFI